MKKILLIATTPLTKDGLTKVELDIINYNYNILQFTLACGYAIKDEYTEYFKRLSINYITLPPKNKPLSYMASIRKIVKSGKYDTIYIHGNSAMMFFEALPAKMGGAKRIVTHCHNTKSDFPLIHYIVKPLFNKLVNIKIACSSYAAKWAYNGHNVKIILNGIDTKQFLYNPEAGTVKRKELHWENNFIIGHVGRFNKQKNHSQLIDIFECIYQKNNDARLLLIGDGELKEEIREKVCQKGLSKFVAFGGTTENVTEYYNAMDLMLMPSLFEGLSIVALEAQANGIPTVLSDCFSPETPATKSAYTISLEKKPELWADIILNQIDFTRNDNQDQMRKKKLTIDLMMKEIRNILFGEDEL